MASVWDAAKIRKELRFLDWQSVLHDDGSLLTLLNSLHEYGLVFLKSIPKEEVNGPQKLADRIGRIRNTFYGPTWDVKSVPNAKNIAYTNVFLGFHMDLLYMTDPPRFQMLQCIHNSCEGGASMFSDSYKAVHEMQKKQKGQYRLLTSFPVTFHYHNAGEHYRLSHPTIETGRDGKLQAVNYSPPFQAPFDISGPDQKRDFKDFQKALKSFQNVVEDESNIYEYKMGEGDMVLFDNRRVLHARRSFDVNSGSRWLKGGYMDADVVDSKHRMLMEAEMMK
jgi:alpha-ketoglutarate-dependent taurine dioxygenase